jgi:hypothetical protein
MAPQAKMRGDRARRAEEEAAKHEGAFQLGIGFQRRFDGRDLLLDAWSARCGCGR